METITVEQRGPVAWVWLDRPRRLNAIDETVLAELDGAFETLEADDGVRAAVLAGRGPVFSAGFDVVWMAGLEADRVAREMAGVEAIYDRIEAFAKPLVAAVHGPAVGGGLLLALVADVRLASEEASFGAPEVKIGIFPPLGLVPRLERVVGLGLAKQMVLSGDPVDAATALAAGLVSRVIPAGELNSEAGTLAGQLASLPAAGVQLAKAAFSRVGREGFGTWEREQFAACWALPERDAAMRAFLGRG